jgi:hypothetical protein
VLSDDLNAVVPCDGGFAIQALPFTGELRQEQLRGEPVPLHALLRLEHGASESVRPMSSAAAVALLVGSAPYVNHDPDRAELLLDRATEIASAAQRAILTFRRDGDPWPVLRALA